MNEHSVVILAGGKSRRMGTDKAKLCYQGETFLQRQIRKGQEIGSAKIYVSGYRGMAEGIHLISDEEQDQGPLGGMVSCFRKIREGYVLVLSIDMPLVRQEDLKQLICRTEELEKETCVRKKAILLSHQGKEEPFPGIYHVSLLDRMEEELRNGRGSVFSVLRQVSYEVIASPSPEHCFLNVNDPVTYEQLSCLDS